MSTFTMIFVTFKNLVDFREILRFEEVSGRGSPLPAGSFILYNSYS
jgi:hypothetical protein